MARETLSGRLARVFASRTDRIDGRGSFFRVLKLATGLPLLLPVSADAGFSESLTPADTVPVSIATPSQTEALADEFIVLFGDGISGPNVGEKSAAELRRAQSALVEAEEAERAVWAAGGTVKYRYRFAVIGFSATVPSGARLKLRRNEVGWRALYPEQSGLRIEQNREAEIRHGASEEESEGGYRSLKDHPMSPFSIGVRVNAGLDRIDERFLPADGSFDPGGDGAGVHVYVIDTGIYAEHIDFGGRVRPDEGYAGLGQENGTTDCEGHGSRVAGIIGGAASGVAKKVILHPIRVFGCSRKTAVDRVIAGVDWVTGHYVAARGAFPAVANMSLEDRQVGKALDFAVANSIDAGITYVVAAGNGPTATYGSDACAPSPARVPAAITVGGVNPLSDAKVVTSNYGRCVDIFAPGKDIISVAIDAFDGFTRDTGTSMAAPHVAGVAALILSERHNAKPSEVWASIRQAANNDRTSGWCGISNAGEHSPVRLLVWHSKPNDVQPCEH